MNRYNPFTICVKCGSFFSKTHYDAMNEVLRRECFNCGHKWVELPLDHKDES